MKAYFRRLKEHPGLPVAYIVTLLSVIAALGNKNITIWWHAVIFGVVYAIVFVWLPVLFTNIRKK